MTEYDPYKLIEDVQTLLRDRGLSPHLVDSMSQDVVTAASVLLRGFGIDPRRAPEDQLNLDGGAAYDSRMHGD